MGNKKYKNKLDKWLLKKKNKFNAHLLIIWSVIWIVWLVIFISSNIDWNINWNVNYSDIEEYNSAENMSVWSFITVKEEEEEDILSLKAKSTIVDFYDNVNNADINWYFLILDKVLRSNDDIRTYFSQSRIDRFLKITNDGGVKIRDINEISNFSKSSDHFIKKWFNYTLEYDVYWTSYSEDWEIILMSYDQWENFFINTLYCTTEDCAKLPFYN